MPTYDYFCKDCGHEFEEFQSITAPPLTDCPKCKGLIFRKIGSGAGLLFKGKGFYITDYKKTVQSESAKTTAEESSKAEKKTSASPAETKKAG